MFVLICNIYAIILWGVRLGSSRQRFNFIHSRLVRTSRPEIPRFRFDFKHAARDVGDHVHDTLVGSFLNDYLEADGYFFIRLLAANVSDFVVQEIVEQLWSLYVMKYGEADAKAAEDAFFEFRQDPLLYRRTSRSVSRLFSTYDKIDATVYTKRKPTQDPLNTSADTFESKNAFQSIYHPDSEEV